MRNKRYSWVAAGDQQADPVCQRLCRRAASQVGMLQEVSSMDKFPALSEASRDFIRGISDDWIAKKYVSSLPLLAYRVAPALYEQFLDKRWEAGVFDRGVYELHYTPAERSG